MNIQSTPKFPLFPQGESRNQNGGGRIESSVFKDELAKAPAVQDKAPPVKSKKELAGSEEKDTDQFAANRQSQTTEGESTEKKSKSADIRVSKKETKQDKIKKFMDSIESEFQIPPTRLVEALNQLSEAERARPLEENLEHVVKGLELSPEQSAAVTQKLEVLASDLASPTVEKNTDKYFPEQTLNLGTFGMAKERHLKTQNQKEALRASLGEMNQSFFKPQLKTETILSEEMIANGPNSQMDLKVGQRLGIQNYQDWQSEMMDPVELDAAFNRGQFEPMESAVPLELSSLQGQRSLKESGTLSKDGSDNFARDSFLATQMGIDPVQARRNQVSQIEAQNMDSKVVLGPNSNYSLGLQSGFDGQSGNSGTDFFAKENRAATTKSSGEKVKTTDDLNSLFASVLAGDRATELAPTEKGIVLEDVPKAQVESNVNQVIQQAQYLVKRGGGEMNVKMSPEGLGDIQLRVELKDGKVQLSMLTENKETKKMLENSVSDLRDSLSQQKIALDSISIDSVVKVNVENSTQFNQSQNQGDQQKSGFQDGRDNRQFWNQFQEQFGGRSQREALFDSPKAKGYAPKRSSTLEPAETASASPRAKSSGLNLVA